MEPHALADQGRAPLSRRRLLRAWVKTGLLLLIAGFAGVFGYGLLKPGGSAGGGAVDVAGLPAGTARLESWNGKAVWVVHRSAGQVAALSGLSGFVHDPAADRSRGLAYPHRSLKREFGIYLAATDRSGVLVRYVTERPDGLPVGVPWHGGFVDPGSDAVFDAAGRRYRHTAGGPLPVPPHRYTAEGIVRLGKW